MNFLIDAQLPPLLAPFIISLGHRAIHVEEAGILLSSDQAIWNYAVANAQTIITKDEDFKNILLLASAPTTPVVWSGLETALTQRSSAGFTPSFLTCSHTFSKARCSSNSIS